MQKSIRGFSILGFAKLRFAEKGLSPFSVFVWFLVFEAYASFVFIPITPLLILTLIGLGIYLIKLGYIDGDIDKIKEFLHDKEES